MTQPTHTVETVYQTRSGDWMAYVRNHALPVHCDEGTKAGDAVRVVGGKAVKA